MSALLATAGPTRTVRRGGTLWVAEYRLRNMWKWRGSVIAFGLGDPILYLTSVGLGIGALVDANGTGIDGVPYLVFLAPALLAANAIQGGVDEAVFPTMSGFIWNRFFFAMRSTSLTGAQIAGGVLMAAGVRVAVTSLAYWVVLLAFGAVTWGSALVLVPTAVMAGVCFAAVIIAVTAAVHRDNGYLSVLWRLVVTPMLLFSGTFFPLTAMPLAVQWIGWISPLWHATVIGRWLSFGLPVPWWQLTLSVAYLAAMGVVGLLVAQRLFERRLTS